VGVTPQGQIAVPGSDEPRVSIVVPTTSQPELLAGCLRSLPGGTAGGPPCETVVVLNGASDETIDLVRTGVDGVRVAESAVNLGVAGGGNLGRDLARGELLIFVHDDTVFESGWLAALVAVADARPEAGAVGSRVLDPDGRLQTAGAVVFRDASSWLLRDPATPEHGIGAADYCSSSSLLVRAETWDAVGGMDERLFPAYYVDVDVGLAVWAAGQSVLCALDARVRHRRGSSSSDRFRGFVARRNQAQVREKWRAALTERVAYPEGPAAAEAAAYARAEAAAERVRRAWKPRAGSGAGRPASRDLAERERAALERASEMHMAYIAELEALAERAEGELHAISATRWWRLRDRIAPALNRLRRLRRP
jgi:GT2 family glycosyltransferase